MTTEPRTGASAEERALVEDARAGRPGAFEALLRPHESGMRSILAAQLRGRPEVSIDEALQESRLYLLRRLDRFNPEYAFGVFARALTRTIGRRFLYAKASAAAPARDDDDEAGHDLELSAARVEAMPVPLRQAIGAERFAAPDATPSISPKFLEMFEVFLRHGGYPHQQAVFGFSILLWGEAKRSRGAERVENERRRADKVPITGDPDRVVREVAPEALGVATTRLLNAIAEELALPPDYLQRVRRPLDYRLALNGARLFARDVSSARQFAALAARITAECRLEEYFGRDARRSVADWTRGVKERIRKLFLDPSLARMMPLPQPEEEGGP